MHLKTSLLASAAASLALSGVVFMKPVTLEDLQARVVEINDRLEEIQAELDADTNDGDIADETATEVETLTAELVKLEKQIKIREQLAQKPTGQGRRSQAEPQNRNEPLAPGSRQVPAQARNQDPRWGFRSFGEFAVTVRAAGGDAPNETAFNRLQNALTTYGNEGTGADGGFLVPPEFRREIAQKVMGEESLLSRTDRQVVSGNSMTFPMDETTPWGSNGIQAYWEGEGKQKQQSKPELGTNQVRLSKLIALVPVTDELLEDAPAIDGYLRKKVPEVMTSKINTAIIRGTGVGQPLGILNSPGRVTVPKSTLDSPSQPADSVWFENITAMYSRMYAPSLPRSVWIINQSILPSLLTMKFDTQGDVAIPVYLPANGAAGAPYGTLMGRPIVPVEAASLVGDEGDIIFGDLSEYLTITKGQDIKTDISIHLFFDYDVTAFRFVFRVAGQPWSKAAITPQQPGAPTYGRFITVADRA